MKLLNYLFFCMFVSVLESCELTGVCLLLPWRSMLINHRHEHVIIGLMDIINVIEYLTDMER